jgi:hypothetical protein
MDTGSNDQIATARIAGRHRQAQQDALARQARPGRRPPTHPAGRHVLRLPLSAARRALPAERAPTSRPRRSHYRRGEAVRPRSGPGAPGAASQFRPAGQQGQPTRGSFRHGLIRRWPSWSWGGAGGLGQRSDCCPQKRRCAPRPRQGPMTQRTKKCPPPRAVRCASASIVYGIRRAEGGRPRRGAQLLRRLVGHDDGRAEHRGEQAGLHGQAAEPALRLAVAGDDDRAGQPGAGDARPGRPLRQRRRGRRERVRFLVSLATMRSSHGPNGSPSRNRGKCRNAFTNASCTMSSASCPAPARRQPGARAGCTGRPARHRRQGRRHGTGLQPPRRR